MKVKLNSTAPDFEGVQEDDNPISLKDYTGKWIILYFYPKDNTPGCTAEACNFRDETDELTGLNAVVIGVSPDKPKTHKNFIKKFDLNFHLVSDENLEICNKYGVWQEKTMCGRKHMGVVRTTFIINPEGKIAAVFEKVKPAVHSDEVKAKLAELQK